MIEAIGVTESTGDDECSVVSDDQSTSVDGCVEAEAVQHSQRDQIERELRDV